MSNIDTSSWKEFRLEELFTSETGDFDIKKEHINGLGVDVVTAGETNNGILGKSDIKAKIIDGNTITVDMFGKCTYRPDNYKMVTHARVFSLKCIYHDFDERTGLYMTTVLQKLVGGFGYSNMCSWNKIKELSIKLPVKETDVIDWDYMQKYIEELEQERIEELEQERIEELEQYLVATGLNDYELNKEDIDVLVSSGFGHYKNDVKVCKEMREFRVGDLFDIHPTKAYKMANDKLYQTSGISSVLSNSSVNNGIGGYCGLDTIEDGEIITFSDTTTGTDTMFYQPNPFIGYAHVQGMYPFDSNWKEYQQRYFICAMKQACGTGWDYSNKFNRKLVAEMTPLLPIQTDQLNNPIIDQTHTYHPDGYIPDWDFMEKYIKAIEKIVIADVVKYKDEMIAKTKEVVS